MPRSSYSRRMGAQRRRVGSALQGSKSFRRLLKNIPSEARVEIAHAMEDVGPRLAAQMRANTPEKSGALRAGIKWRVSRRLLRLQVGLIGTKRGRAKLFYGYILNFGRKAQKVNVRRRTPSGAVSSYVMNVRGIRAKHFVTGGYRDLRSQLNAKLRDIWSKILKHASAGAGND